MLNGVINPGYEGEIGLLPHSVCKEVYAWRIEDPTEDPTGLCSLTIRCDKGG